MRSNKWMFGIAAAGLVVGLLLGLMICQSTAGSALRYSAQSNLMEGYALIRQGNGAWKSRDKGSGRTWTTMGVTFLLAGSSALEALGVRSAPNVANYMQYAEGQLVEGKVTSRQMHVIRTFLSSLQPLSHTNFGSISNRAIAKALDRVNTAISKVTSKAPTGSPLTSLQTPVAPNAQCQPSKTLYAFPPPPLSYPEHCQGETAKSLVLTP